MVEFFPHLIFCILHFKVCRSAKFTHGEKVPFNEGDTSTLVGPLFHRRIPHFLYQHTEVRILLGKMNAKVLLTTETHILSVHSVYGDNRKERY